MVTASYLQLRPSIYISLIASSIGPNAVNAPWLRMMSGTNPSAGITTTRDFTVELSLPELYFAWLLTTTAVSFPTTVSLNVTVAYPPDNEGDSVDLHVRLSASVRIARSI